MDLQAMLPSHRVQLRVTRVRVEGYRIVQSFGPKTPAEASVELTPPDPKVAHHMYFRGGTLRFKKMTMADPDMQLVDLFPEDPLDFSLAHYYDQLLAGYIKTNSNGALINFVPDYHRHRHGPAAPEVKPPTAAGEEPMTVAEPMSSTDRRFTWWLPKPRVACGFPAEGGVNDRKMARLMLWSSGHHLA